MDEYLRRYKNKFTESLNEPARLNLNCRNGSLSAYPFRLFTSLPEPVYIIFNNILKTPDNPQKLYTKLPFLFFLVSERGLAARFEHGAHGRNLGL